MTSPVLYQICDAAHVSGLTLTAEIGLGATIGYQAEIHADSIEIKGIDTDSDIITIGAPLPLGTLIGGTKYESLDYSVLVDWAHFDAESNLAGALLHGWSPDTTTGIWFRTNTTGTPTWWEVFFGGSDTVESSYTSLTNGARYVLFLRYVAATQTATFWVIDSGGTTLSEDSLVLTNPLIWDTVANTLRHSFFRGYIYRRAYWASALTPAEAEASLVASFEVVGATAIGGATIRVFVSEEPRARSKIAGTTDALDRRTWQVQNASGPPLVVEEVVNAQSQPTWNPTYPDAWSVDLVVSRRILFASDYVITAAPELESADGTSVIDPASSASTSVGVSDSSREVARLRQSRDRRDLAYSNGAFVVGPSGGVASQGAPESTKKRIFRRLTSAIGGFSLLRDYGAGLQPKKQLRSSDVAVLRATIVRQLALETDLALTAVDVALLADGIVVIKIAGRVRGSSGRPIGMTARLRSGRLSLADG